MRLINEDKFHDLYNEASQSNRKRSHYLLHSSHNEKVQRLIIALIKGSFVEPHYHELPSQWEMFVVLDGELKITLYGKDGEIIKAFHAGPELPISIVEFNPGDIHSVECISDSALMLEIKEGPFDPAFAKVFPDW